MNMQIKVNAADFEGVPTPAWRTPGHINGDGVLQTTISNAPGSKVSMIVHVSFKEHDIHGIGNDVADIVVKLMQEGLC